MSEIFGIEGGGAAKGQNQGAAKKKKEDGPKKPSTGEGEKGKFMQYDNEMGAMMLDIPARYHKYRGELEEDLMDAFYGAEAGGKQMHQTINEWLADWLKRKADEDPTLLDNPDEQDG
jgi:hypothetical protein